MKYEFKSLFFTLTILVLVGSPMRWIQAEKIPKVSSIIPGEALVSHMASISFEGRLDPAVVHSHGVKMSWSKPRHYKYDESGRELSPPPSLAHTVAKRLSNQVFTSLVSKLPYTHVKQIFEWKSVNKLLDLEPDCKVVKNGVEQPPIQRGKRSSSNKDVLNDSVDSDMDASTEESLILNQQQQGTIESCHVNFTSLHPLYGISFNFKLSFHNKPMTDLSPQEISSRTTPDHRGWTQPILNTDVSVSVKLCSPDFVSYNIPKDGRVRMAGNGNVSWESIEIDQRNVEEAIRALLKRAKVVLGLAHVQNLLISEVDDFIIVPISAENMKQDNKPLTNVSEKDENFDSFHGTMATESTLAVTDHELIPEILQLCQKYEMNEEECMNIFLDLDDDDVRQNNSQSKKSERLTKNKHVISHEMDELDIIRLRDTTTTTATSNINDIGRELDLSMEDHAQLMQDIIAIDRLIDGTSTERTNQ